MDEHCLHHTLLPSATYSTTHSPNSGEVSGHYSDYSIVLRILLVISVGLISTWANHEAEKGFDITVNNEIQNTPVGKKFSLFYVSNDEATWLVQTASDFAMRILYPGLAGTPDNLINRVDIRLVSRINLTRDHIVVADPDRVGKQNNYIISLNPHIMELGDFRHKIRREIQRGMAEILLLELQNRATKKMLEAMVEYITNLAGLGPEKRVFKLSDTNEKCWEDEDSEAVAEFLGYCEEQNEGFIGRLIQAMIRERNWDEETLNGAFGMPAKVLCESFRSSMVKVKVLNTSDSVSAYK